MNDTAAQVEAMMTEHHRRMTPLERLSIAAQMFETARAIVESSLPANLAGRERRLAWARRFYGNELPEAALIAYADYSPAQRP